MRTVLWLIYEVLYLVIAIPEMIRCRRMYRRGEKERLRSVAKIRVRNWARSMLRFAGVTVEVHGPLPQDVPQRRKRKASQCSKDTSQKLGPQYAPLRGSHRRGSRPRKS